MLTQVEFLVSLCPDLCGLGCREVYDSTIVRKSIPLVILFLYNIQIYLHADRSLHFESCLDLSHDMMVTTWWAYWYKSITNGTLVYHIHTTCYGRPSQGRIQILCKNVRWYPSWSCCSRWADTRDAGSWCTWCHSPTTKPRNWCQLSTSQPSLLTEKSNLLNHIWKDVIWSHDRVEEPKEGVHSEVLHGHYQQEVCL